MKSMLLKLGVNAYIAMVIFIMSFYVVAETCIRQQIETDSPKFFLLFGAPFVILFLYCNVILYLKQRKYEKGTLKYNTIKAAIIILWFLTGLCIFLFGCCAYYVSELEV